MFNFFKGAIPKNIINSTDNILTKINAYMKPIDSGISRLGNLENAFLGTNNINKYIGDNFNKINILKNNALNNYGFIKDLLGLDGTVFLEKTNGVLGGIPILVKSTSYSKANTITDYATYDNNTFSDNMFIENYNLDIELIAYGTQVLSYIKNIIELSNQRTPISFIYDKLGENYSPVAITEISYSEDYQNQNSFIISVKLKQINLLENMNKNTPTNITNLETKPQVKALAPKKTIRKQPKKPTVKWVEVKDTVDFINKKRKLPKDTKFYFDKNFALDISKLGG